MSRSKKIFKKALPQIDPVYNSRVVGKLINKIMHDGKKAVAAAQIYKSLEIIKTKFPDQDPAKVLEQAFTVVSPRMEVRSRRVGGASYQVPSEVRGERKTHLAMKWVVDAARDRSSKDYHTFAEKLAAEVADALNNTGNAVKKRDQMQKMADANRAFAHLRW